MAPPPQASGLRRWAVRLGVVLLLAAAATAIALLVPKKAVVVRAAAPQRGAVRDVVSSSAAGEVTPEVRATVRAELAGRVVAVLHKAGDRVEKGQFVVQFDPADLDARVRQAQASVNAVASQIAQSEARLSALRRQAERARMLLQRGAGTAQISEDAESAVREAGEAVRALQAQLAQARATLETAKVARSHADLVAPFSGLLTEVLPNVGETLTPAVALAVSVFSIIDDGRLHIDATIDEADAAKVRPGQEAELKLDALPDQIVPGRVARVDPSVKRDQKGARTLGVEVEVLSVDKARQMGLKPGMSANVDIVVAEKHDVLYLPTGAVIGRGVNRAVYVLVPEGRYYRAHKRTVHIGVSNWDRTEIASGIEPGELVATNLNAKGLDDGVLVKIEQIEKGGSKAGK